MIWSIAWRNIWRNKLRSTVVILAVSLGLFGALFLIALSYGMVEQKIDASIRNEISHIQVHHPEFLQDRSIHFVIPAADSVCSSIAEAEGVSGVSSRLTLNAMASTAANGNGVTLVGIDPDVERSITLIHTALIDGDYFEKKSKTPPILLSKKSAENLKAKVGSKVVITLLDADNNLTYGLFRVCGIYKTSNQLFDQLNMFVRKDELANLLGVPQETSTEIAVLLKNTDDTDVTDERWSDQFPDLSVMSWKESDPMLEGMRSMMDQFTFWLIAIILAALAFGIVNTMLMSILERTRELGMLMAVGMNRRKLFMMIMLETIMLAIVGAAVGIALSALTITWTGHVGINFAAWAEGLESQGYSALVYPELYLYIYVALTLMVIITAILSSLWPARKALMLKPAEAVREE